MGNRSFCHPFEDVENYDRCNTQSSLKTTQRRELAEFRPQGRRARTSDKTVRHVQSDLYEVLYADGGLYRGALKDGLREGRGKYCYPDGISYQGEWELDEANGRGTLTTGQFVIEGDFRSNSARRGTMRVPKKKFSQVYEGQFYNFAYSGRGKLTIEGHSQYEGEFVKSKKHGVGTIIFNSGYQYEGQFCEGRMSGKGTYTTPEVRYTGEFENNKFHGKGHCEWKNGSSYAGEYISGRREGPGVFVSSEGRVFRGQWSKNKPLDLIQAVRRELSLSMDQE